MDKKPEGAGRRNNMLTMIQQARLVRFVEEHYVGSGMSDDSFAERAAKELSFAVSPSNVYGVRNALGLQSEMRRIAGERRDRKAADKAKADQALSEQVNLLQMRVDRIGAELAQLMSMLGVKTINDAGQARGAA